MSAERWLAALRAVLPAYVARGKSLRVAHLVPSVGWGGAERLACSMARLCEARGIHARVDAPSLEVLDAGIEDELGARPPFRAGEHTLERWALAARRRVREHGDHVVHAHLPYPDRLGAAMVASAGRPLIVTFQLLPLAGRYWPPDALLEWRSDNCVRRLSRAPRALTLVAPSREDEARLAELVPRERLVRVGNAPPLPRTRQRPAPPLAWPEGRVKLLCVGRLVSQKGYDTLLTALADPAVRALDWSLVLAGDGPERAPLEALTAQLGLSARVLFAPEQPAAALYGRASLVLSPSRWEGMPLVPQEAVEAGAAVLLSSIAPHRELLEEAPEGLLHEDAARWPGQLAHWLGAQERRDALLEAQTRALAGRSRDAMMDRYVALYRAEGL